MSTPAAPDPAHQPPHSVDPELPREEWDLWTTPQQVIDVLPPSEQMLLKRLRRRRTYYRLVSLLPPMGWGSLLIYALLQDGRNSSYFDPGDAVGIALVLFMIVFTGYCLFSRWMPMRIIGYILSAGTALIGSVGGCLLGALLAFALSMSNSSTPGPSPWMVLISFGLGSMASGIAFLHTNFLIIASVRINRLQKAPGRFPGEAGDAPDSSMKPDSPTPWDREL